MAMLHIIGDVQGCFHTFLKLVAGIPNYDEIWLAGDTINRGPDSLKMLRWIYRNQDRCKMVLGNHDLHAISVLSGIRTQGKLDTLYEIESAPDRYTLIDFLRQQPLILSKNKVSMVHAGMMYIVDFATANKLAHDININLQGDKWQLFLQQMFNNQPSIWSNSLLEHEKLIYAMNSFTRMRYATIDGRLDFQHKNYPNASINIEYRPWFEWYNQQALKHIAPNEHMQTIVFGHWSDVGLINSNYAIGIDTGCVWRKQLTAVAIDSNNPANREFFQQSYVG
jgi:bis(5'-nucleosyl)-tetraphosphatase (symmetrical)